MRRLRSLVVVLAFGMAVIVGFIPPVYAQDTVPDSNSAIDDPFKANCSGAAASSSSFCKNAKEEKANRTLVYGENSLIVQVAQLIVFLTGLISVIMIIIGGFKYIVSNGDANGVTSAKNTIMYAVVGLVVAVSCQFIVSFVLTRFI